MSLGWLVDREALPRDLAWVRSPVPSDLDYANIRQVPRTPERELLSLAEFLRRFPDAPLNIARSSGSASRGFRAQGPVCADARSRARTSSS